MVARVTTVAFEGTTVLDIDVQVQMSHGLPKFNLVGLPDKAVGESRGPASRVCATRGERHFVQKPLFALYARYRERWIPAFAGMTKNFDGR